MAKVVRGHRLRSNQYLLARVYDADAANANASTATIVDAEGNEATQKTEKYYVGQLLVIKGTEVSFYMPPTGIEVIPVGGAGDEYVRDAVTLERLEYAILKDEDGEKRYVHGPAVVFPEPTEVFVEAPKGGTIFRALELSPISGIYIKVIAEYEENGKKHPIGEELFITGNEQMIYYPRPEHAMIQYDGKYMHHAIAIPEGEGRYIMNRLTGEIKTVVGPRM
jgi:major vault protein